MIKLMNKNYIKSLINEMFDQNILNSEEDRAKMKELIAQFEDCLDGNFGEDLKYLSELWEDEVEADENDQVLSEEDETQNIDDVVNNLKVGFNYVPGIGVGFCSDEKDLEAMKNFVRGGMTVQAMFRSMLGF